MPSWCIAVVCAGGKAEAVAGLEQGVLQAFKVGVSKDAHFATDFEKWVKTDQPYNIQHHWVSRNWRMTNCK